MPVGTVADHVRSMGEWLDYFDRETTMRHVRAWFALSMLVSTPAWAASADPNVKAACRGGDARQAVRACSRLIDDRQLNADERLLAYVHRANAYDTVGERDRAKKDYSAALAIAPKSPWVYRNRGAMFMGAGQLEDALRDFDAAVSLDPSYGYAWTSRCNVRRLLADRTPAPAARRALYEQALVDCEQAFAAGRLDEFLADTHEVRGLVHQALGHVHAALDDFSELIRLRPDSGRARLTRADTLRLAAQRVTAPGEQASLLRQAAAEYQHAITVGRLGQAEVLAHYNRGLVRFQLRQLDLAIADFTKALDLAANHPLLPYIYAGRAMALADAGSMAEARKDVATVSSLTRTGTPDAALDSAREYVEQRGL